MDWIKEHFREQNHRWKRDKVEFFLVVILTILGVSLAGLTFIVWLILVAVAPIAWSLLTVAVVLYTVGVVYWGGGRDGN